MSRDRANEIEAMRRAHEEYIALRATVARITRRNPIGLKIRPLFGQRENTPRRLPRAA